MTGVEIKRIQFLDLLFDFHPERPGEIPSVAAVVGDVDDHDEDVLRGILRGLASQGLIQLAETYGFEGTSAVLTSAGRMDVESRRRRRGNRAARNAAARDAVLAWVYTNPHQPSRDPMESDEQYFLKVSRSGTESWKRHCSTWRTKALFGDYMVMTRCSQRRSRRTALTVSNSSEAW